jgi:maltose-binding protein MalE
VTLNHIPSAGDYEQIPATLIAVGNALDVFFITNISMPSFAVQGTFMSREHRAAEIDLDAFRYEGELIVIPQGISNLVLFYSSARPGRRARRRLDARGLP